ncbi:MAG: iron-sulfur cluster assembly scaffold protein [Alphaproteobacteria bacterium]|nr:iron-sulfur cluster assembly scaffold protein [Alphaproteobacteria bacterium]
MTASSVEALYSDRVKALAADIPRAERLARPDATVTMTSPLCGSRITVDVTLAGDQVSDFGQTVRACTLGQASASIMGRHVVGRPADEVRAVAKGLRAMLKEGAPPPAGEWADLAVLAPAQRFKSRHGSILLAFDAVVAALDDIQGRRPDEAPAKGLPDTMRV